MFNKSQFPLFLGLGLLGTAVMGSLSFFSEEETNSVVESPSEETTTTSLSTEVSSGSEHTSEIVETVANVVTELFKHLG